MMNSNQFCCLLPIARFFAVLFGVMVLTGCDSPEDGTTGAPPDDANSKSVVLFQYAGSPLYDHGVNGVIEGLKEKGYVEGKNLKLTRQNANASPESAAKIAEEIGAGEFDLIVATGTQTLQAVAKADPAGKTPVVFGMVANPFRADVGLNAAFPERGSRPHHGRRIVSAGSSGHPPREAAQSRPQCGGHRFQSRRKPGSRERGTGTLRDR